MYYYKRDLGAWGRVENSGLAFEIYLSVCVKKTLWFHGTIIEKYSGRSAARKIDWKNIIKVKLQRVQPWTQNLWDSDRRNRSIDEIYIAIQRLSSRIFQGTSDTRVNLGIFTSFFPMIRMLSSRVTQVQSALPQWLDVGLKVIDLDWRRVWWSCRSKETGYSWFVSRVSRVYRVITIMRTDRKYVSRYPSFYVSLRHVIVFFLRDFGVIGFFWSLMPVVSHTH